MQLNHDVLGGLRPKRLISGAAALLDRVRIHCPDLGPAVLGRPDLYQAVALLRVAGVNTTTNNNNNNREPCADVPGLYMEPRPTAYGSGATGRTPNGATTGGGPGPYPTWPGLSWIDWAQVDADAVARCSTRVAKHLSSL